MTNLKFILPLLCLSIVLGGCPYKSELPIDNPSVKVDEALLGKWEPKSASESVYVVTKLDDHKYKIVKKEAKGSGGEGSSIYTAFVSNVGGDKFLNLKEGDEYAKDFYFYKMELSSAGTKLTLVPVTENIDEVFTSSEEMKKFFEKNKGLSFFYDKTEEVYYKADK